MEGNGSNASDEIEEPDPLFDIAVAYFSSRFAVVFVFTILLTIVNVILLLSIICEKNLPSTIRFILSNIVAANEMLIVALLLVSLSELVELYYPPFGDGWRVFYIMMCSAAAARLLFMATYAVLVYLIARYTGAPGQIRLLPLAIAMVVIWIFATIPNFIHYLSLAEDVSVEVGALCSAHNRVAFDLDYLLISLGFYGIIGFSISIPALIFTICYLKANNKQIRKGLVKFTVFLLIGNVSHFLGITIPLLFSLFDDEECYGFLIGMDVAGLIIILGSLLITPIIILALFNTIRARFKRITCCVRHTESPATETVQTQMPAYADF